MMTIYVKAEILLEHIRWEKSRPPGRVEPRMSRLNTLERMFSWINLDEKIAVDEELFVFLNM